MREDIYGGLKNALERGDSIDSAIRSFLTAGYNEAEVREAASALSGQTVNVSRPVSIDTTRVSPQIKPIKRNIDIKFIILSMILIILVVILLGTLFFKETVTALFSSIFG